jgi:hypothetical protein
MIVDIKVTDECQESVAGLTLAYHFEFQWKSCEVPKESLMKFE